MATPAAEETSNAAAFVLWRRLDAPGHDACRLERHAAGWQIDGAAVFREDGMPARLDYRVRCDFEWMTQHGHVCGWLGAQSVEFTIVRTPAGVWTLNGAVVQGWRAVPISISASPLRQTCYQSDAWLWPRGRPGRPRPLGFTFPPAPSRCSRSATNGGRRQPTGMRRPASPMRPCSRSRPPGSSAGILDSGKWNPEHDQRGGPVPRDAER